MLRLLIGYIERPSFARSLSSMASTSTPSTGAAPAAVPNTTPASAPSKRHRIRKPAATQRVAATSDSSSQPSTAENGTATHHARPDGHWRGGPSRGGAPRGRGNGAGRGRGAATRGFSSTSREEAVRASSSRDVNDLGHRLARHGLGPALDPSAVKDLSGQREFSTTSAPAETALEAQVPPSGRRKKGKGKQDGTGSGVDEAAALLQRVALKEGEAGGFDEEVQRLFEVCWIPLTLL